MLGKGLSQNLLLDICHAPLLSLCISSQLPTTQLVPYVPGLSGGEALHVLACIVRLACLD